MNRKKIFFILFLILLSSSLFAIPVFETNGEELVNYNEWDLPFIEGIVSFGSMFYNFMVLAKYLVTFFFMLNIFWQGLMLMLQQTQIKKVFVDVITKTLLINSIMFIYPSVVDGGLSLMTNLGVNGSGGATVLVNEMMVIYESSYQRSLIAKQQIEDLLTSGDFKKLSQREIDNISKSLNMSDDEVKKLLSENNEKFKVAKANTYVGVTASNTTFATIAGVSSAIIVGGLVSGPYGWIASAAAGVVVGAAWMAVSIGARTALHKAQNQASKNAMNDLKSLLNDSDFRTQMIINKAFNDVFNTESILSEEDLARINGVSDTNAREQYRTELTKQRILGYFSQPFLAIQNSKDEYSKNFRTSILSPCAMIKIGYMEAQIIRAKAAANLEVSVEDDGKGKKKQKFGFWNSSIVDFTKLKFEDLSEWLVKLILPYLLIIPVIFCVISYIVLILEYYIVTSIGIIFVPFLLFDGTKHYAKNLITMFVNYWVKIMTTSIVTFYACKTILHCGLFVVNSHDSWNIASVGYCIFNFMFVITLSKKAPEIGTVLVTGHPNMNLGDVAHTGSSIVRGARAAGHAASRAGHNISRGAHAAAQYGEAGAKSIAAHNANKSARNEAVNNTVGSKQDAANRGYANSVVAKDKNLMNKYAQKDAAGNVMKDDKGNIQLNEAGKQEAQKWAQYDSNGKAHMAKYDAERKDVNKQLKKQQHQQYWQDKLLGTREEDKTALNSQTGATKKDRMNNLNQAAQEIQKLWEG